MHFNTQSLASNFSAMFQVQLVKTCLKKHRGVVPLACSTQFSLALMLTNVSLNKSETIACRLRPQKYNKILTNFRKCLSTLNKKFFNATGENSLPFREYISRKINQTIPEGLGLKQTSRLQWAI